MLHIPGKDSFVYHYLSSIVFVAESRMTRGGMKKVQIAKKRKIATFPSLSKHVVGRGLVVNRFPLSLGCISLVGIDIFGIREAETMETAH